MRQNEKKFYQTLEDIFTGAEIEGESGYVNLLKIKADYYRLILAQFQQEVAAEPLIDGAFKEEFFDALYAFFARYFSESGSVYFVKSENWQRVYEQIYADNKDVVLFWKTHMLYYVKSDILFRSIDVVVRDAKSGAQYPFYFDAGALEAKQNNEKKEIVFSYKEKDEQGRFVFDVAYSEQGKKTKLEDAAKEAGVPAQMIERAFKMFRKQSEVDFFINKNAEQFLTAQLEMFMHQMLLAEDSKFEQTRLNQLRTVQAFAAKLIRFIAQFEDELVKVWNKPKFALDANYVITLDKLGDALLKKIARHKNLPQQAAEWLELGMVEKGFDFSAGARPPFLPLDTKYFKDLEIAILAQFEDLDGALDGRLIRSDNYQALNTLQEKYKGKVQCVYIDPPFNTDSSPIIYANNYKHSSWLTLMANRLEISRKFLSQDGINITAIDDIELRYLITALDSVWGDENYITTIASKCNPQGRVADKVSKTTEYHILHAKDLSCIDKIFVKKHGARIPVSLKRTGTNSRRDERPNRYYPILIKDNAISMIADAEYQNIYNAKTGQFNDEFVEALKVKYEGMGYCVLLPRGKNGEELVWQRTFNRVKEEKDSYIISNGNIKTPSYDTEIPKTLWDNNLYSNPEYGSEYLKHILGHSGFETPKSYHTIKQFLTMFDDSGLYLDYFGGSASSVDAVIKSNKEDGGERKYMLVEMGEHFNTVILPRVKKICCAENWRDGKALDSRGVSQFFKYYTLEQYEDTLRNMCYKESTPPIIFDNQKAFEQYVFAADNRFADVLEVSNEVEIDFDKFYPNIDFAETISNLKGLPILKISKTGVRLKGEDGEIRTDYNNMSEQEKLDFLLLLKPLIWWGD